MASSSESSLGDTSEASSITSYKRDESKFMSLVTINAQSLRNKLDLLTIESEQADIIAVTETWLHPEIETEKLKIPDFHEPIRRDREGGQHGGVAIYCRETHTSKERKDLEVRGLEAVWAEITARGKKFLVGCMYRPPNSVAEIWDKIEDSIESAKNTGIGSIYLLGDLNCDQQIPGNKLETILTNFHMTQLVHEPTHITPTSQTILDIIATTSMDMVKNTAVMSPSLSNHCTVGVLLNMQKVHENSFRRKVLNYNRADWKKTKPCNRRL
jgi:hypothetical protein